MRYLVVILIVLPVFTLGSCFEKNTASEVPADVAAEKNELLVDYYVIGKKPFAAEFSSTGIIYCTEFAEIQTKTGGKIMQLFAKNGSSVAKGALLAKFYPTEAELNYRQSLGSYTEAEYRFENELLGLGYSIADTAAVPKKMLQSAKIRSGLNAAENALLSAKYQLSLCSLTAPFSGVVANLTALRENSLSVSEVFCTLLNTESYTITFPLLHEEASFLQIGTSVQILPLTGGKFSGLVSEINPLINENGMILVKAQFRTSEKIILHGAKADIIIERQIPELLEVPAVAVVKRGKHKVIYSAVKGQAIWNEVTVVSEKMDFVGVQTTLKAGDTIICSNNYSLDHQVPVKLNIK